MRNISIFSLTLGIIFSSPLVFAKKVELEDIKIQGELHNDNRLRFYQRNREKLKSHVRLRSNFRDKIQLGSKKHLPVAEIETKPTPVDEPQN
ncbi:MAG: hypothetical protein AB8E15_05990 [Bdellovibrionales bacterium]